MKNNNSFEFWLNYYKVEFKKECESMNEDYTLHLNKWLKHHKNNYSNRSDKENTNSIIQNSIKGQLNQIKAIETILKPVMSDTIKLKAVEGSLWRIENMLRRSRIRFCNISKSLDDVIRDKQAKEIVIHYTELKNKIESEIIERESIYNTLKNLMSNNDIDTSFKYAISICK